MPVTARIDGLGELLDQQFSVVSRGQLLVLGMKDHAAGIIPLHFSPRQIRREPAEVVRLIRDALHNGLQRPPLPIRTIPCPSSAAVSEAASL